MPFSFLLTGSAVILAWSLGDVQATLLSILIVLSLFMAVRAQITSSWRDRAEAAEQSLRESTAASAELQTRMAQLEALPNLTEIKAAIDEHDRRSVEAWTSNVAALHDLQREIAMGIEVLKQS